MKALLSQNELADKLGVTRQLVARWREEGRIRPSFHIERTIRYDLDEVLRQLAEANQEAETQEVEAEEVE